MARISHTFANGTECFDPNPVLFITHDDCGHDVPCPTCGDWCTYCSRSTCHCGEHPEYDNVKEAPDA